MQKIFAKIVGLFFGLRAKTRLLGYAPYPEAATNTLYNLLFCDDLALAKLNSSTSSEASWSVLSSAPADRAALEALALDSSRETPVRVFAYHALLKTAFMAAKKELLGIIVEVGLKAGLETLAAYNDGRTTYIDASGHATVRDTADREIMTGVRKLFQAGEAAVAQTGPWDKSRLIPPPQGVVRITLLVSDGLYFGHGPIGVLQQDPIGGPVLKIAAELVAVLAAK